MMRKIPKNGSGFGGKDRMYKRRNQGWLKHIDFILWDEAVLQLAFILAYIIRIRRGWGLPYFEGPYLHLAVAFAAVDFLISSIFNTMHNVMSRGLYREFSQTTKQVLLVFAGISIYLFSVQQGAFYSRILIFLTAGFHFLLGYPVRLLWKPVVLAAGKGRKQKKNMILVADESVVEEVVKNASEVDHFIYSGLVLINRRAVGEEIAGLKVVADMENAAEYICREWVDEVFIFPDRSTDMEIYSTELSRSIDNFIGDSIGTFSKTDYKTGGAEKMKGSELALFIERCRQMSIPIHIRIPISSVGSKTIIEKVGGYKVFTTTFNYASPLQYMMKRCLDVVGGLIGSLFALIIMLIAAPAIKKESPGPVLFKQKRIGLNGKRFTCYKLRTMYMDAEERKKELMEQNRVSDGMMFKMDFDPRIIGNRIVDGKKVTGIGEFLRRSSLDEFPQFFNVLAGQMSLVGTRPPTEDEWEKYKYHHRARLATKPGITGLWQVSGRSSITDFEEVVRLDTEYIQNWSIGLDLRILMKTVGVVLKKDGAM